MTEEGINGEETTVAQQWRDGMKRQVHNIIVSTLEASETMLEELDPDSDPEELHIELMVGCAKCRRCNERRLQRKLYGDGKERGQRVSGRRGRGRRLAKVNSIHSAAIKGRPSGRPFDSRSVSSCHRPNVPPLRETRSRL
jgi:hypothetical protein